MAYTLHNRFEREEFRGGRNILASEHLEYVKGGATLDAAAFGVGYIPLGTLIMQNEATGKYEPVTVDGATGALPGGYRNFAVLNIDAESDGENDMIAGEVIVRGSVYEAKLPSAVPDAFKDAVPMIQFINAL